MQNTFILRMRHFFMLPLLLFLMSIGLVSQGQTVVLDQADLDYAPGETVYISGEGWAPNEAIKLVVDHLSTPIPDHGTTDPHLQWTVTADANGNFTSEWYVSEYELGAELLLLAEGAESGVTYEIFFTDAIGISTEILSSQNTTTTYGSTTTADFTYQFKISGAGNTTITYNINCIGLPAGVDYSPHSISVKGNGDQSVQLKISTGAAISGIPITVNVSTGTIVGTAKTSTLTIGKAIATVTANNKSKIYGDENPALDATVTGTVNGDMLDYSLATSATQFSGVADYPITVTLGLNPNYNVTANNGTFSVTPKDAAVTANNKSKIYGDENPSLDATVTGTVNGDMLNYSLATPATQFSGVADYPITVTLGDNPNYNVTANNGTLSVTPKDAAVTANNKSKIYGDENPALDATVTGTVNGDVLNYSLSTSASQFSGVADYPITVTLGDNPNYNVTANNGTLSVTPKAATVTANNKSKIYGEANPALDATVTGTVNGDMLDYSLATSATRFSGVADYPITVTLGLNPNYNVTANNGALSVTPKAATVIANNKSKIYADENPSLDATVTGTVNGDVLNYILSTEAVQFSGVADYPITVTLGLNPNYNVTANNGTLSVTPKAATVTANNKSKIYGDENPALDAAVTGTVNGDVLNYSLSTSASQFSGVADYPITVTLGDNSNYNVTANNGTLSVTPKDATVTANNKSKIYGQINPALDATVTGSVNGDMLDYSLATSATQFSGVADYPITVTLGLNPNYNVTANNGTLSVTPKDATVTANNKSKIYGDENPYLDATVTGTVNGDMLDYSLATTATQFSGVADYPITVTLGLNPNYNVTANNGTLSVTPKDATVTANNKSKIYGDENPALDATVTGTVNGDVLNYSLSTEAVQFSGVADYPITVTLGLNPNYNVTANNGTLSVTPKDATVTANNKSKIYGDENPYLDATVTGTVNGDMLDYSLATTAIQFSGVADYLITVILGLNPNYNVTANNGTLSVTPKDATVTANNKSKIYGDENPYLDATVTGTVNGDMLDYSLATTAIQFSGVADYLITVTLGLNPNYNVTANNGTLSVTPKAATVTANNKSKIYGDENPYLDATVTGTVNGDMLNYSLATSASQFSGVADYPITVTLGDNSNYNVTPNNGTLSVTQRDASVTPDPVSKYCGQKDPTNLTGQLIGFLSNDNITAKYSITQNGNGSTNEYIITAILSPENVLRNYKITYNTASFTIYGVSIDASASSTPVAVNSQATLSAKVTPNVAEVNVKFLLTNVANNSSLSYLALTGSDGVATVKTDNLLTIGVYKVEAIAGTDCSQSVAYIPVYDGSGNFVTGGGWINSPLKAYKADESLYGKANFGFVSKYKKGSNQVDGNTEFQFQAGSINFKSTLHEAGSLVISGKKATYRGEGTINGQSGFKFTLVAIDGDWNNGTADDQFRIKIWGSNGIVYDNGLGADESSDVATTLGGGSIVIHEVNKKSAEITPDASASTLDPTLKVYPNPFAERLNIAFSYPTDTKAKLEIYSVTGAKLQTLYDGPVSGGQMYNFEYLPRLVSSQVVFYHLTLDGKTQVGKVLFNERR